MKRRPLHSHDQPIQLFAAAFLSAALAAGCTAAPVEPAIEEDDSGDTESAAGTTVAQAMANSCGTVSVKGLSRQIIEEARCMNAEAYAKVPDLGNVSFGSGVFPYLEKPARDRLVKALKSKSGTTMTVNSMLRTVAQQYLLYGWFNSGRCGIGLAAKPGNSNHETGLAIDVSQYSTWKGTLQANGFHWLGSSDPVHFDYAGAGAVSHKGLDVKAFQRLWNRNHPNDKIDADGLWGPQTEARMKKSPAAGFAKGPTCGSAPQSYDDGAELAAGESDDNAYGAGDVDNAYGAGDVDLAYGAGDVDNAYGLGDVDNAHDDDDAPEMCVLAAESVSSVADDDACSTCFDAICEADAHCCETEWDDRCVATGMKICEALCGKEAMGPL
jgi:hypothetical protein